MAASTPVPSESHSRPPRRRSGLGHLLRDPRAVFSIGVIVLVTIVAVLAPLLAPYDPQRGGGEALVAPLTDGHLLGTDHIGRDMLSRLIFGARVSLTVGFLAAASAMVLGIVAGGLSGYLRGWVDTVLMGIAEFFQSLPRFVLALIIVAVFGSSIVNIIVVLALLSWPQTARVVRSGFLSYREAAFVDAARVGGMSAAGIIVKEILPNVMAPVIVVVSLDVATAILLEAALGFFGLGDANHVSWGGMLNDAQQYLRRAWWMSLFPGAAITVLVLALNLTGDRLNEAFNPRSER